MNTTFVTFVYPQAKRFFVKFIQSLEQQTDKQFKLIIFNDGCSEKDLEIFKSTILDFQVENNSCKSIAHNRYQAIEWLYKSKYDLIIFGDIDDTFSSNRVEVLKRKSKKYPIIINELQLCNEQYEIIKKNLVGSYLKHNKRINKSIIKEANLIGFSHLGIQRSMLSVLIKIHIDEHIKVVDWLFATYLFEESNVFFENGAFTNYIQHENNIALNGNQTLATYKFILDTKVKHYSQLITLDYWYKKELEALLRLQLLIENDSVVARRFELYMNTQKTIYYPWWIQIKNSKELERAICI